MLMYRDQQLKGSCMYTVPNGDGRVCVCAATAVVGLLFSWTIVTALMEASTAYGVKLRDLLLCVCVLPGLIFGPVAAVPLSSNMPLV